jgi:hypothetical protein
MVFFAREHWPETGPHGKRKKLSQPSTKLDGISRRSYRQSPMVAWITAIAATAAVSARRIRGPSGIEVT